MKKILLILFTLGLITLLVPGCASNAAQRPPSALEQKFFAVTTNYVTEVHTLTNTVTVTNVVAGVPQVSTNYLVTTVTNVTPSYNFAANTNATQTANAAGATTNLFAPGLGALITSIVTGLFGLWGTWRSRRSNQTAETLAQIIETGQQVLLTAPNGPALAAAWKAWMVKHQAETGVIANASQLVANVVDTEQAKAAAEQIVRLMQAMQQPKS